MASMENESSPDLTEEINIVLLSQSGVGKSTFINSCFNYLKYNSLNDLLQNQLLVLIPARINIEDMYRKQQTVELDVNYEAEPDDIFNEVLEDGKAATQDVRTYVFLIFLDSKKYKIRFVDTPGIGDGRGTKKDQENCDLILGYLSQLEEVHGFCILLRPTNPRLDVFMNYCIVQILSRLESSAVNNVAFIFTNTRGSNFSSGDTLASLQVLVDEIRAKNKISIPLCEENIFCFDNEPFRYVAALNAGVKLHPFIHGATESSWNYSSNEFWNFLFYISQLKPHDLKKTLTVNEARNMASNLSQPVTEIIQLIQGNITTLEQHSEELSKAELTKNELLAIMHRPLIDLNIKELDCSNIVCTHRDCTTIYEVNGIRKIHYKSACCEECCSIFPKIIDRSRKLSRYFCKAFDWSANCKVCSHPANIHIQISYVTEIHTRTVDQSMAPAVNSQEEMVKLKEKTIQNLKDEQHEFKAERQFVLQSSIIFDQYLKKNSVTATINYMEEYLKYEIDRESLYHQDPNDKTVNNLLRLLSQYENEKKRFEMERSDQNRDITPEEIQEITQKLLNLPHFGPKIRKMYDLQQSGKNKFTKKREKVVKGGLEEFFKKCTNLMGYAAVRTGIAPFFPHI